MTDEPAPAAIGRPILEIHVGAADTKGLPAVPRFVRALMVGLLFSILPVLLTSLLLTRDDPRLDPRAFMAAFPVIATAFALFRPRDRWYAVGEDGFALGERYFGQVRWEQLVYEDVETVEVSLHRETNAAGTYRFTRWRYAFGQGRARVVLEGETKENDLKPDESGLPPDEELPEESELRVARLAVQAWEEATGRQATTS